MANDKGKDPLKEQIDGGEAWGVTVASMIIASLAFGAPYIVIVALIPIATDFGGYRSIPSAAASFAMLGTGDSLSRLAHSRCRLWL